MSHLYCVGSNFDRIETLSSSQSNIIDLGSYSANGVVACSTLGSLAILDTDQQDIRVLGHLTNKFEYFITCTAVSRFICIAQRGIDDIVLCYVAENDDVTRAYSLRDAIEVPILYDSAGEVIKLVYLSHNGTEQPVVLDSLGQVFTLNGRLNIDEVIIDLRAGLEHYALLSKQGNLYIGGTGQMKQKENHLLSNNPDLNQLHLFDRVDTRPLIAIDCAAWSTLTLDQKGSFNIFGLSNFHPDRDDDLIHFLAGHPSPSSIKIAAGSHHFSVSDESQILVRTEEGKSLRFEFDRINTVHASFSDTFIVAD